jgi:tRNA A-37 threonylcarbamoyl transferase component Bud32
MTLPDAILIGCLACVLWLGARWITARAYLRVNPRFLPLMQHLGLTSPRAILSLPAVIVSGHPDRNVSRVTLGAGQGAVNAFLKREHRVRFPQRILNFFSGFGPVSLSQREADTLDRLRRAEKGCPEWIAVGADGRGRAFLLVEEISGCVDLRRFLSDWTGSAPVRHRFAKQLGETLARLHESGFVHRDLYAKHILVQAESHALHFLDWQRSPRRHRISPRERWHDLAALDATLAEELADPRERLLCLHAYCKSADIRGIASVQALTAIRKQRRLLLQRRHIREARQLPEATKKQELIWLDGEALCITPDYFQNWNGKLPSADQPPPRGDHVRRDGVLLSQGENAFLTRRRSNRFFAWMLTWFGANPLVAPEVRHAGLLFRLQRYGVRTARLLAFGQRPSWPWRIESFLLTESPADARGLLNELDDFRAARRKRTTLLREAGVTLQRLHSAGCFLRDDVCIEDDFLTVHESTEDATSEPQLGVTLSRVDCLRLHRRPTQALAARDLATLCRRAGNERLSQSDRVRFVLTYFGLRRLNSEAKRFVGLIQAQILKHRNKGIVT